jgi:tetratricopeptide (TPR) repeat protein
MPSAAFERSVAANLAYWLSYAQENGEKKLQRLDKERHNLWRAIQFGIEIEATRCAAAELILQVYTLIERRGYWQRWIPLLEKAVDACHDADGVLKVQLLDRLGQCYRLNRQWENSLRRHEQEQALARRMGDAKLLAKAHLNLSQTYWSMRQYVEASAYGERALSGFKQAGGDAKQLGAALSILGLVALGRGELEAAEGWLREARDSYRAIHHTAFLARTLMNLTITLERAGRFEEALVTGKEALSVLEPTEYELDKARLQLTLGTIYMDLQRWEEAEFAYRQADSPALRRAGDVYLMALVANNLGSVLMEMGRLEESHWALTRSIALARKSGGRLMLANSLGSMAETKLAMKREEEALPYLDEAIAITAEYPDDGWGRQLREEYTHLRKAAQMMSGEG